jgi:CO/xanthine dehydrogenase Mo-binding subunit
LRQTLKNAADAARVVRVRYEAMPHLATVDQAMAANARVVFKDGNTRQGPAEDTGDLDAGFRAAAHVVEQTYSTHVITHCCLETHGCVCEWDGDS